MPRRLYLLLLIAGVLVALLIAAFQPTPGYIDADYYFAGGVRLVQGHGFTETYIWNYLDNPTSLPHPSHSYWSPLVSIIAAAGMFLTGQLTYPAARIPFILIAALIPPLTAFLTFKLTRRRDPALLAGSLALFPTFLAPSMVLTDTKSIFMLLGGLFFILLQRPSRWGYFALGLVTGLMHLTRNDGILWVLAGGAALVPLSVDNGKFHLDCSSLKRQLALVGLFIAGYLLFMGPWMWRNWQVFGTLFSPASKYALWFTSYDDMFAYPRERVNMVNWLASGWGTILQVRLAALRDNLVSTVAIQGGFFLFPLIIIGMVRHWNEMVVRWATYIWLVLIAMMTLLFPFAAAHGTLANAATPFYPLWWGAAVLGLDAIYGWLRKKRQLVRISIKPIYFGLFALNMIFTLFLLNMKVFSVDNAEEMRNYEHAHAYLATQPACDVVMASNSPLYYLVSGSASIIVPNEEPDVIYKLAEKFRACYLVLDSTYLRPGFDGLYDGSAFETKFEYLIQVDSIKIFRVLLP